MAKGPDGSIWLVNVAYHPEQPRPLSDIGPEDFGLLAPTKNGDQILLRRFDGKAWQPAIAVTGERQDVWRPTVAVDGKGVVWVAWAQQIDGNWEIFRRTYTPPRSGDGEGTWSEIVRVTERAGVRFPRRRRDRRGRDRLARLARLAQGQLRDPGRGPEGGGRPERAAGDLREPGQRLEPGDRRRRQGERLRRLGHLRQGQLRRLAPRRRPATTASRAVADSPRFEGRPHLACDKNGRVWIAYEEGDEQWGKDYAHEGNVTNVGLKKNAGFALYVNRTVKVKCLADDRLMQPAGALDGVLESIWATGTRAFPGWRSTTTGASGSCAGTTRCLAARGEVWVSSATRYDGRKLVAARGGLPPRPT